VRHHALNEITAMAHIRMPDITSDTTKNPAAAINRPTVRKPFKSATSVMNIIEKSIAHI